VEYATKRYRSNLINWGIVPFTFGGEFSWEPGTVLSVPGLRAAIKSGAEEIPGYIGNTKLLLKFGPLSREEREILLAGCLMNWYRGKKHE
jgi:hypothetical protein